MIIKMMIIHCQLYIYILYTNYNNKKNSNKKKKENDYRGV